MNKPVLKYHRVMLKLSGELFGGQSEKGINYKATEEIAQRIKNIRKQVAVDLAIVIGGGNIVRGKEKPTQVDEVTADQMGMLGTVINGLAFQEALERLGEPTRMMTAFEIKAMAEPYIRRRTLRHLDKDRIIILTGGIGTPGFSTDTTAAVRAKELGCDVVVKATSVDGVYSDDPKTNPQAQLFTTLTYQEAITRDLKVMDGTAFAFCRDKKIPIIVFNVNQLERLGDIVRGQQVGTLISSQKE